MKPPRIERDKRAIVVGRTGSGKTTLARYLLLASGQHVVIFNPKHTIGYSSLPGVKIIRGFDAKAVCRSIRENRFTVINFDGSESTPEFMDSVIDYLHRKFTNICLCVDELFTLHTNGRPGPGLLGWLTRGRELKQSFIGLSQRPRWISRFVFSEADYIGGMDLKLLEDRKSMQENTGDDSFMSRLPPYYWRWYNVADDEARTYRPVTLQEEKGP